MRRAQIVLDRGKVAQALCLRDLRVVAMHVTHGPDQLHVEVEGDGVPVFSGRADVGDHATLAWEGLTDAPRLPWPEPAGPRPVSTVDRQQAQTVGQIRSEDQRARAAAADGVAVHMCQVDETVGGGDETDAGPDLPEGALPGVVAGIWQAAADATRAGVPPLEVVAAVQDAIRTVHAGQQEDVRRHLLETTERTLRLLRRFLGEDGGERG